jgi:Xaa-Pro aminopeptidase
VKELIKNRVSRLRSVLCENRLDACVIFGADPHLSEYLPERWQTRRFISGFTGSAGTVIITAGKAALWTDSRYFLQAQNELAGTGIDLVKLQVAGEPTPDEWLKLNLEREARVGTDEWCVSVNQFRTLKGSLSSAGIYLAEAGDLPDRIWPDRPGLPEFPVFEHELKYASTARKTKFESLCAELEKSGADCQIITALDDLAWTFNLRGTDVECNPVFVGYGSISRNEQVLFTPLKKISAELQAKLRSEGILLKEYDDFVAYLHSLPEKTRLLVDPDRTSHAILKHIPEHCLVVESLSVATRLKSRKSESEIAHIRQAMRKDGAAMVEFLYWLETRLGKIPMTEFTIAEKLIEFRSHQPEFKGISFYPIVGYREHGAVVHFHVTGQNALPIVPEGFLLFDSGGQYSDGTTDITRTVALSALTRQQKRDFTLVLKGMISLTLAVFPVNTRGCQLDILARKDLWRNGLNYGHGTGHGVGYFLNVHEGPMSIRQEFNDRVIEPGMVLSNEPALYRPGEYGLRTENMMVCLKHETTPFGDFLCFDTLTLCPIDTKCIDKDLLNSEETDWLNAYHERVFRELEPVLRTELKGFLKELTRPI